MDTPSVVVFLCVVRTVVNLKDYTSKGRISDTHSDNFVHSSIICLSLLHT